MVRPLPSEIDQRKTLLWNSAYELEKQKRFEEAEPLYLKGWEIFPEPKYEWDWSQSTVTNLAMFYLEWRKYREAEYWAKEVFKCNPLPNDPGPYILLGKIYLEGGREDLARQYLFKAFELGGRRGFQGEDPKYLNFVLDQKMKAQK